ncbi:hypothetical protein BZA77DRAFT_323634 [Pyronema omphalodes]|nr:hypothetical protein BZA77DRAFT_323634 [Pyronema omphalodes]
MVWVVESSNSHSRGQGGLFSLFSVETGVSVSVAGSFLYGAIGVLVSQRSRNMLLASAVTTAGLWVVTMTLATCYAIIR